jgi:hypothetical protein
MNRYLCLAIIISVFARCATYPKGGKFSHESFEHQKLNFFTGEVKPLADKPCFEGAYYRKLVSSTDEWMGIEGVVVLPEIKFDEGRKNPKKAMQYLDNPSIYFGGNMDGQETDIGLTWEVIKDESGIVSKDRRAFRPFLRRTAYKEEQNAIFQNAPAVADFYWYPEDEVKMSVKLVANKTLRFVVEGAGKKFERDFICNGFTLNGKAEYKRVNAIDQVGNEGAPVEPTHTEVLNAVWKQTNLYRKVNNSLVAVPFHGRRYTAMLCPLPFFFKIFQTAAEKAVGAETITISGLGKF